MWWSFKFSWQNFLLGALCGAIVIAAGAWWRSTRVEQPYRISYEQAQDPETYDECLAAGNTTVACDALMRVLARSWAEQAKVKQKPEFDPNKPYVALPNGPWDPCKPQPDSRPPLECFEVKPDAH
jgi:hypothetical protein